MTACALLVFAKEPRPGYVKTRLVSVESGGRGPRRAGFVAEEEAAEVYAAFLSDAAAQFSDVVSEVGCDVRYHIAPRDHHTHDGHSPDDESPDYSRRVPTPRGATLLEQFGDTLGARMLGAFTDAFAAGYIRVVIIGTDHPTLPTAYVTRAFDELKTSPKLVVGPSDDGGYYLLGMNTLYPALFDGMVYSRPDVFSKTMERAAATMADVTVLPYWFDVDTPESLIRLWREVVGSPGRAPATHEVLSRLARRYNWS